jgi:hypothetical protein
MLRTHKNINAEKQTKKIKTGQREIKVQLG